MVGAATLAEGRSIITWGSTDATIAAVGSMYKVQFLLAPKLSLATLPRPSTLCIRFRLAPGFCFAAYQFNGNSPSSDKVCTELLCRW